MPEQCRTMIVSFSRAEGLVMAPGEKGVLSGLGSLQTFLVRAVDELTASLLRRAISDFNEWLVSQCRYRQMNCD